MDYNFTCTEYNPIQSCCLKLTAKSCITISSFWLSMVTIAPPSCWHRRLRTKNMSYNLSLTLSHKYDCVGGININYPYYLTLRKHAYSNILQILPPKSWKFSDKNSGNFHISAQNIDFGYSLEPPRRCGSNEYPQCMFLSRNNNKSCRRTA